MSRTLLIATLAAAGLIAGPSLGHAQSITSVKRASARTQRQAVPHSRSWFVNSTASGPAHGASWWGAFNDLQQALVVASAGDRILVAAGTYKPTSKSGPQSATFFVPSGVALYGGFAGGETLLSQRDPVANVTILSGDIGGDDILFPSLNIGTPNSWNVVTLHDAAPTTRVDGFRIQAGHLYQAPGALLNGAGMHLQNSSPTVANCVFTGNLAEKGAAIHSDTGSPTITDCTFTGNRAISTGAYGGAIHSAGGALTVRDSSFTSNSAEGSLGRGLGGAIASLAGTASIEGCTFTSNTALPRFGTSHTVSQGGAIYVGSSSVQVSACSFIDNESNVGGAISTGFLSGTPTCQVLNSVFSGNFVVTVLTSGGWDIGGDIGGIHGSPISTVDLIGCVVHGGTADNTGGAKIEGLGTVSSSIFWGNSDNKGTIGTSQVKASRVEYSCVMNMLVGEPGEDPPDPEKFPGSTALDPLFTNAGLDNFRLQAGSPCIDAGENPAFPAFVTTDRDGNPRFVDDLSIPDTGVGRAPVADMGPYEKS